MKQVQGWQASDGSIHPTKKAAAVHELKVQHGDMLGEAALGWLAQRPREIAELLNVIGDEAPVMKKNPKVTVTAPAKGTRRRGKLAA